MRKISWIAMIILILEYPNNGVGGAFSRLKESSPIKTEFMAFPEDRDLSRLLPLRIYYLFHPNAFPFSNFLQICYVFLQI